MSRTRFGSLGAVPLAAILVLFGVSLFGISKIQTRMDEIRTNAELTDTIIYENAPPVVAFFQIALGGFRGLLADLLFLRVQKMQRQGNYFELVQLGSWIVKLQPRFTAATSFLAWNMSYNVSVTFQSPQDRWRWVQLGIELIRDEALNYNPGDPNLFRELGWIYQHKLGQNLDDWNKYYKYQLALHMIEILGNAERYDWQALADAPLSEEALFASLGQDWDALTVLLETHQMTYAQLEHTFRDAKDSGFPDAVAEELKELGLFEALDRHFRRRWLEDRMNLDPVFISKLVEDYGYLDFRLPEAHAIYWARQGLQHAPNNVDIGCERMIAQSLKNAYFLGKLIYIDVDPDPNETSFITSGDYLGRLHGLRNPYPRNVDLVDSAKQAFLDAHENHPKNRSFMAAFENFMVDAIVELYSLGREAKAAEFLRFMRHHDRFKDSVRYRQPLNVFALYELARDVAAANQQQTQSLVQALIFQSLLALATGDDERVKGQALMARRVHNRYTKDIKPGTATSRRRGLPPFADLWASEQRRCLQTFPADLRERLAYEINQIRDEGEPAEGEEGKPRSKNLLDLDDVPVLSIQRHGGTVRK